jgi:hypothetical protein
MSEVASTLCLQGDLVEAERQHRKVLAMYRRLHGAGAVHSDIAGSLKDIAQVLYQQGKVSRLPL